ncbi:hypothetical protein BJAS_P0918 [Bathymodiolus japonicus methanotrophic gill symbiont]|uniref:DUF3144 domain-containing protein n=1 Tax=Bathymodiolus japonicus methanotrophic gill symbiont TaxID=113269 RepID=UPI001B7971A8|nr:DUF3144 domain-containing protein [Bathymodiolus japonicus methanotrophic gill symbiont]GFO71436.1 hypothetical protein BJAS_P0918 [Bathymodiolus japonicus methanotrophic gill symbiont]
MTKPAMREYNLLSKRFIALANEMENEGKSQQMINAALMSASGIYTTYTAAGNAGGLNPSGVDQVVAVYKANLENVQKLKRQQVAK